jgi:F-type H+-transporting ATPase subunit delta
MSRERNEAYARAMLEVARGEGPLADIEDDMFRFVRIFETSDELRSALTDPHLPVERRLAVVDDLTERKSLAASVALLELVVAAGRAGDLPAISGRSPRCGRSSRSTTSSSGASPRRSARRPARTSS